MGWNSGFFIRPELLHHFPIPFALVFMHTGGISWHNRFWESLHSHPICLGISCQPFPVEDGCGLASRVLQMDNDFVLWEYLSAAYVKRLEMRMVATALTLPASTHFVLRAFPVQKVQFGSSINGTITAHRFGVWKRNLPFLFVLYRR